MSILNVALLQAEASAWEQEKNLARGEALCRAAREQGADVALFPEMWNVGYRFFGDSAERTREQWEKQAIATDGPWVGHFRALARELEMAIALTYLQQWPGGPRNAVSLIDRTGEVLMTYAKVHTCQFFAEGACTPGDGFHTCTLTTAAGDVRVGAMICYDREHPESARVLMLQGAEIILTPNACGLEQHRLGQFKARAFENMLGLAMANYPKPHCNGHSIAVDPICTGDHDIVIVEAGEDEGVFLAPFDLDAIREYRAEKVWGNAYRKPRTYGALTSMEVEEPFVRANATR